MAPRGRPRRRSQPSESGASVADTEPDTDGLSASASRPRRSRQPKRYFDDDYSPPPSKKRAPAKGRCSESGGEEEQEEKAINHKVPVHTPKMEKAAEKKQQASKSTPKPRGRPKKAPTPTGRRKSKKQEEEVVYMDEDSEDQESSDEEYEMPPEEEEIEEELELSDYKVEKLEEEDSYCPWLDADPDTLPKLDLPESSQDIPLPNHATFDAIEVYEILRSYHRTLRITPFTFEDFCAALISYNNSCIIAEVHIALLRICLKSDEEEQTHYSVTETNNAVNIMIHHLETMTYAEILRQYIEAYPYADDSVRAAINAENYPYVGYEPKLVVLLFMCYRFLYSSEYKKVVTNVGRFQNDDNCRVCGKSSGRIVGCSQCEASFHVECSRLNPFPEVLVCNICTSNSNVRGVSNAIPFGESIDREPLRSQPIGRDRYGRYYWFVCRRLVVQSLDESEIHYYSTPPQLYQLVQRFDRTYYEKDLCEVIKSRIDEFLEQMTLTVEMTNERRDAAVEAAMKKNGMPYEYVEPATPQIYLQKDSTKRMASILRDCAEKAQVKQEVKDEPDSDDEATRSSGPLEIRPGVENDVLPESMIGIYDGRLINTFWSGGSTQEELVAYYLQKPDEPIDPAAFWRMGDETNDQTFMSYYNYYSRNEMAESSTSRKKQADKKKYMSSRFAILDNFEWVVAKDRQFYGNSVLHTKFVSWTLSKISRKIPADLMHRRWLEVAKQFDEELNDADDYHKLVMCLLKLDAVIRKTVFVQQWWSGLGQTKLERRTVEQRETFMKEQQKNKKAELDALAKDLDESFVRVNYMKPKWPNTYILRQKGESYRNAGRGGMGGWAWVANKYIERKVPVPEKPVLPLASEGSEDQKTESAANRKARNLESLIAKMKKVRREKEAKAEEPSVPNFLLINRCYTPTCAGLSDQTFNPQCYSPSCRYGHLSMVRQKYEEEETAKKGKLGEEKAWPIPDIQTFTTKHGKSLFVLPKRILRQMIVTGGCQSVYMPGFVPTAKSNQLVWSYPAPRPTLDLCWKWATLNAKSLHAVALQLKIMWSSIKWSEFEPDDQHPDRRVVIDTPSHDERRRIISHKEMPPYGQYERYQLEIEIIPLHEENDGDEEESWTSRRGTGDCAQRVSARKKRPGLRGVDRRATSIRKEWVDGVTLKVFEIKDYWKSVRQDADRAAKKRVEAMRKAQKAREDAERQRQQALVARQQKALAPPTPNIIGSSASTRRTTLDRVPYVPVRNRDLLSNGRYLEKYNSSQISPRTIVTGVPGVPQPIVRVTPSPIVRKTPSGSAYTQYGSETRHYHPYPQQNPSTSRAAAGADGPTTTYRAVVMQGNTTAQPAMRVTANGYQFPENVMRGGGRVNPSLHGFPRRPSQPAVVLKPFGEPINDMRRVAEEAVSANAGGSDGDEQPPVIPRYDRNSVEMQQQQQMQQQAPRPAPIRQIVNIGGTQMRAIPMGGGAPGSKGLVVVRQPDGSQKIVMRAAGPSQAASSSGMVMEQTQPMYRQDYPPGTVLAAPPRVVTVRGSQSMQQQPSQQFRALYSGGNAPRYVRISGSGNAPQLRQSETVVRRIVPNSRPMFQEYSEDKGAPQQPQRFVLQGSQVPPKMPRVAPRGGMTMQMVQQQHPDHHRRLLAGRQKPKVTTYRDFMASRGYLDASKFMMQAKPITLPFEFNEEEEREINEAIAREEEWMRLEEENKASAYDSAGNPIRSFIAPTEGQKAPPYVSNLLPSVNDTPDEKTIKQVLDVMFSQVCRWDRQYGWSKAHMKRARQKNDTEKMHLRKFRMNQREMLLADHMERLKKEINKRRTKMENEAEKQCGLLTPWRKSRARPHRTSKLKQEIKKEVINPADITLGGDTFENMVESKPQVEESIASGVARRRRTSANLSKSEDDAAATTTRPSKERRTSLRSSGAFFGSAGIDIDTAIAHCICQQLYDPSRFYVQCEMCARWYHGDCVGVSERKVNQMESWTCEQCIEEQDRVKSEPALYCICKKPYDDSKFYVGCDSCQGWFHPECVGITREQAEQAADYNCPECLRAGYESGASEASVASRASSLGPMDRSDYVYVLQLLELLLEHRMSTPFRHPVDLDKFPDYEQHVKKPMDLSTISEKVEAFGYQYLREFVNDVHLMFENAKSYNPKDHAIFKCAETMQEVFEKKLIEVKDAMLGNRQRMMLEQQPEDPNQPSTSSMSSARKRVQSESQRTVDSLDIDCDQLLPLDQSLLRFFNFN